MSEENNLVAMTIEVVASYVAHNNIRPDDLPEFIAKTHAAISGISREAEPPTADAPPAEAAFTPAVTVRKSLASPDHILSMIDGKPYKSLKRHLGRHGLTPAEYRARYGLKAEYPMVAPGYSAQRREVAQRLGLGRKPRATAPSADVPKVQAQVPAVEPAKPRNGRKAGADAAPAAPKRTGRRKAQAAEAPPSES